MTTQHEPSNGGCQVVDVVFESKTTILRDLDQIAARTGRPQRQPAVLTPPQREQVAVEHVTSRRERPESQGIDPAVWISLVVQHLEPLPDHRPFRRRRSGSARARRNAHLLEQIAAATAADREVEECRRRAESAYAAWAHLNGLQLAGDGEDGDLVSECLADDMTADDVA